MESTLIEIAEYITIAIEAMAILMVAFASGTAFVRVVRIAFGAASEDDGRETYVRYLRWLIGGLTFLLAADIVHTSIAPTWEQLAQVGAVAVIRTFLSYFAARDVREATELELHGETTGSSPLH